MWRQSRLAALALAHGFALQETSSKLSSRCESGDDKRLAALEKRVDALESRATANKPIESSWAANVLEPRALFTESDVSHIVKKLAAEISAAYANDEDELVLVGLLDGVFMFLADLSRELTIAHEVDFVSATSYGANTVSSGNVRIKKDAGGSVRGKHVLIVDEMCDSGRTLASLAELFSGRDAKSVKTCVLLDKIERRVVDVKPNYVGAVCPDEFVIGYGMDWNGKYRSLPFVGVLKRELYETPPSK